MAPTEGQNRVGFGPLLRLIAWPAVGACAAGVGGAWLVSSGLLGGLSPYAAGAIAGVAGGVISCAAALRGQRRLTGMRVLARAVTDAADGEPDAEAVRLDIGFGPEAAAWNRWVDRWAALISGSGGASDDLVGGDAAAGETDELLETLWFGMILLDANGEIVRANGAAGVLLGKSSAGLRGVLADALFSGEVGERLSAMAAGTGAKRLSEELQLVASSGDERCVVRLTARALKRSGDAAVMVALEDVTQQRLADEAHRGFVAQATHELRTPLTNIRLYLEEAIEYGEEDPAVVRQALNVIGNEAQRLERLVGDMLSVSEIEAGSLALAVDDVTVELLVSELEEAYGAQASGKGITFSVDRPPKLPVLRGDRGKIASAIHNVIGNALKYTPEGGSVTVRVSADDHSAKFEVEDTGLGIDPAEHERVFEKFTRANDPRLKGITGSGLGLALAREVVRLHGGDITLESAVGQGSTFTVFVPTVEESARRAA
ncbi:MAG: ATP-binding protein [Planctomycetota bacterium]